MAIVEGIALLTVVMVGLYLAWRYVRWLKSLRLVDWPQIVVEAIVFDVVHPGMVTSINDGDRHHIGFVRLCELYGLDPHALTTINVDRQGYDGLLSDTHVQLRHYFPDPLGRYSHER